MSTHWPAPNNRQESGQFGRVPYGFTSADRSRLPSKWMGTPIWPASPNRPGPDNGATADQAHVCILLAVLNGAETLPAQLQSLALQSHRNWQVIASDDGSDDASPDILNAFSRQYPMTHLRGPGKGSAANFMSLIQRMGRYRADPCWLAFCDQDDVWLPDRLSRGIAALSEGPSDQPALYCSRTWITDARLGQWRLSPRRPRPPSFANALVQNIAGGNTILLNPAATRLVRRAACEVGTVVVHDWWVYQLITGAGGRVVFDDTPTLLYRQHGKNQIGANDTWAARLARIRMIMQGVYKDWNDTNLQNLTNTAHYLDPTARVMLERFLKLRQRSYFFGGSARLVALWRLGVYRQSPASTLALWAAALLGRM